MTDATIRHGARYNDPTDLLAVARNEREAQRAGAPIPADVQQARTDLATGLARAFRGVFVRQATVRVHPNIPGFGLNERDRDTILTSALRMAHEGRMLGGFPPDPPTGRIMLLDVAFIVRDFFLSCTGVSGELHAVIEPVRTMNGRMLNAYMSCRPLNQFVMFEARVQGVYAGPVTTSVFDAIRYDRLVFSALTLQPLPPGAPEWLAGGAIVSALGELDEARDART